MIEKSEVMDIFESWVKAEGADLHLSKSNDDYVDPPTALVFNGFASGVIWERLRAKHEKDSS